MRVAVVDIGTNSTRLLVAEVDDATGAVTELERQSTVTRLGQGVAQTGVLGEEPMGRVFAALDRYRELWTRHEATKNIAVLTSATRDASNGQAFTQKVRDDYGLDAREISGDQEAKLSFLGATSERTVTEPTVVIDIGGGSTEFIVGEAGGVLRFHVSTQAGVVRHGERFVHHDPPQPDELQALAEDVRAIFASEVPREHREAVRHGIAVAGTATSAAAIDQGLDPYDPERVHGYRLSGGALDLLLSRLAAMPNDERREVAGLHPDRAPTIVPGIVMLREVLSAFGLDEVEVSEHDILRGAALHLAGRG